MQFLLFPAARSLLPYLDGAAEVAVEPPLLTYTGAHMDSSQHGGPGVPLGELYARRGPGQRPEIASPCFRWFEGDVEPGYELPGVRQAVRFDP